MLVFGGKLRWFGISHNFGCWEPGLSLIELLRVGCKEDGRVVRLGSRCDGCLMLLVW